MASLFRFRFHFVLLSDCSNCTSNYLRVAQPNARDRYTRSARLTKKNKNYSAQITRFILRFDRQLNLLLLSLLVYSKPSFIMFFDFSFLRLGVATEYSYTYSAA